MRSLIPLLVTLFLVAAIESPAQRVELDIREVATDFDTPWEIAWGPDDYLWVTERPGQIFRVHPDDGEKHLILTVKAFDHQESGLYGLVFHPQFADTPHVFITYSYQDRQPEEWYYRRTVERYTYDAERDTLVDPFVLIDSLPSSYFHNGGRLLMLQDGTILMAYGDQIVDGIMAQSHDTIVGKTLRMTRWGTAPADNPFPSYEYPRSLMYSTGHRNPQGLLQTPDGKIFSCEHGPSHSDEINWLRPGRNFGWPTTMGYCDNYPYPNEQQLCADSNMAEAFWTFYSGWDMTVAPGSLTWYDGPFEPWKGSILLSSLKNGLMQFKLDDAEERVVESHRYLADAFDHRPYGRVRDMAVSPEGRIFIGTSNLDGREPPGFPVEGDDRILELTPMLATTTFLNVEAIGDYTACSGGMLDIELEVGGPFEQENVFVVQMSDRSGSFESTVQVLDTLRDPDERSLTSIPVPHGLQAGLGYRVRVISTAPADTSGPSVDAIGILEGPGIPIITREYDDLLTADGWSEYQWYTADTVAIDTATSLRFTPAEEGWYLVRVTNIDGCSALSAPFEFLTTGVEEARDPDDLDLSQLRR